MSCLWHMKQLILLQNVIQFKIYNNLIAPMLSKQHGYSTEHHYKGVDILKCIVKKQLGLFIFNYVSVTIGLNKKNELVEI